MLDSRDSFRCHKKEEGLYKDVEVSVPWDECFREISEGDIDMRRCATEARMVWSQWLIYEHDAPADSVASVRSGVNFLTSV